MSYTPITLRLLEEGSVLPKIGIITALPKEYVAVEVLLDKKWEDPKPGRGAGRRYLIGEILASNGGTHQVVLTLSADIGNNQASARATLLLEHYPNVDTILMVGIAAGVPNPTQPGEHVRLGDIVVSNRYGVIQYDFEKEGIKERVPRHPPRPPSALLLEAVRYMEMSELRGDRPWVALLEKACGQLNWSRPSADTDRLAASEPDKWIPHPDDPERIPGQPRVFQGPIASANKLLKKPLLRDRLRSQFQVKCVEMEGSGIADAAWNHEVGYLVIRGISDYADDNKNDVWQKYAAVAAASYAIALLRSIPAAGPIASQVQPAVSGEKLRVPSNQPGAPVALAVGHLVITIHGIRTNGAWQKNLVPILNLAGFSCLPLDYGFFHGIRFLVPWLRKRQVIWFRKQYAQVTKGDTDARPSVVAHSFGTYIVARALEQFPELKFDRIIFCGSIVRPEYPWSVILDRGQAQLVLNDYGGRDFVVAIAPWLASDTGKSGKDGFNDDARGRVLQRGHEEFRHSDYFYDLNYQETWIPFLRGKDPAPLAPLGTYPLNWRFLSTMVVMIILVPLFLGGVLWWFGSEGDIPQEPPPPPTKAAPPDCIKIQGVLRSQSLLVNNHTNRKLRIWHWTKSVEGENPAEEGWMELVLDPQASHMTDAWRGGCHFIVIDDLDARLTKRRVDVGWRPFKWDDVSYIDIQEGWKHDPDSNVQTR